MRILCALASFPSCNSPRHVPSEPLVTLSCLLLYLFSLRCPCWLRRYSYREGEAIDGTAAVEDGRTNSGTFTAPGAGDNVLPVWKGMAVSLLYLVTMAFFRLSLFFPFLFVFRFLLCMRELLCF